MVLEPERYIEPFAAAGASMFTLHPEATIHIQRHLAAVRRHGMLAGLALNPASPLTLAEEVITDLDVLLIMTVNPGSGGQDYLPSSTDKIRRARELLQRKRIGCIPRSGRRHHAPHDHGGPRGRGGYLHRRERHLHEP
jgi:ribulose-phosphate 3-epimerase